MRPIFSFLSSFGEDERHLHPDQGSASHPCPMTHDSRLRAVLRCLPPARSWVSLPAPVPLRRHLRGGATGDHRAQGKETPRCDQTQFRPKPSRWDPEEILRRFPVAERLTEHLAGGTRWIQRGKTSKQKARPGSADRPGVSRSSD
ncbi:hypothetical protein NDU88_001920 [Pleurodeles waltl]|uniref:Uncharacterized protein n=1 Tax=Pleurodeles waltl TaxID=8319 RepID=A0AAV7MPV2_PLEWA|nr:hypothetical protein NDU88_001920 [Pleurodeles waltl]